MFEQENNLNNIRGTQKIKKSGFVLLLALFTLLSITLVFITLTQSTIEATKSTSRQFQRLNERQLLSQLSIESAHLITSQNLVPILEKLNSLDYVLNSTMLINFVDEISCVRAMQPLLWQDVGIEIGSFNALQSYSSFALLTEKQDESSASEEPENEFYLVVVKHCVKDNLQPFWLQRWDVYKVYLDGGVQLQAGSLNTVIEPINQ